MKRSFFCDNCGSEVDAELEICPICSLEFKSTLCPRCSYSGKGSEFLKGCPRCGYLAEFKKGVISKPDLESKKRGWNPSSATLWSLILLGLSILGVLVYLMISKL